jgi:hypothetical protein
MEGLLRQPTQLDATRIDRIATEPARRFMRAYARAEPAPVRRSTPVSVAMTCGLC